MSKIRVDKLYSLTGHRDCIYTLERSSESNMFFSGAGDGMVVKWDLERPDEGELIAKLPNSIYAIHHHDETGHVIVGHNYDGIHVLDANSKKEVSSLHIGNAAIFDIKSIGNTTYVALGDGEIVVTDMEKNAIIHRKKAGTESARTIAIHPDRSQYAVGFSDNMIRVYNSQTHELVTELAAHTNSVFTLQYSITGNKLFSAGRDAHLKIWDTKNWEMLDDIVAHMYAINNIAFHPDGKLLATCSMDKSIKVWDAEQHKLLKVIDRSRHAGHGTSVNKLLWTDFNEYLLSGSDDQTISVWGIKNQ